MRLRAVLIGYAAALACVCLAEYAIPQDVHRFRIRAGNVISGTEEYRFQKTAGGFEVTGSSVINRGGVKMEITHTQVLDAARELVRYRMEASVAGQLQIIEAMPAEEGIRMRVEAGGQVQEKTVEKRDRTMTLDNLIANHYQVLLDSIGNATPEAQTWWFLVPQQLAAVAGRVTAAGEESGVLQGREILLRKFSLEAGSLLVEFWAEVSENRLMRITVPLQSIEIIREGFEMTAAVPAEKKPAAFLERLLSFQSGVLDIPGTLCLPANHDGRVPAVVMVAGSGPNDRDETIGPNKPFRDIAHGLAEAGIATLRYDKRNFAFRGKLDPKMVAGMTVKEEVIDDAAAALQFVSRMAEVDPSRVFLLGHSLGATLTPYIAAEVSPLRGIILLAPAARPLDQLIADQVRRQLEMKGQPEPEIAKAIEQLKAQFARIRSGEAQDAEQVMSASAHYWRDLFSRDIPAAMGQLGQPVLLLQGGKDIQVTRKEYDLVKASLEGRSPALVESHWLADVNHLFMKVTGEPTGAEYGRPGRVDEEVIRTIATWIASQTDRRH